VENLGLRYADAHPYARRAYPPASEETRQVQLPIHRNDLCERLPFSTLPARALVSRLLRSPGGGVARRSGWIVKGYIAGINGARSGITT